MGRHGPMVLFAAHLADPVSLFQWVLRDNRMDQGRVLFVLEHEGCRPVPRARLLDVTGRDKGLEYFARQGCNAQAGCVDEGVV